MSVERILGDVKDLQKANEYLKSQIRVMKEIIEGANGAMPRHCKSCKHFIQHYTKYDDYHYGELDCGHCVMRGKGIKHRGDKHATDNVCEFYEMGEYGK